MKDALDKAAQEARALGERLAENLADLAAIPGGQPAAELLCQVLLDAATPPAGDLHGQRAYTVRKLGELQAVLEGVGRRRSAN